jgi:phage-related protein
MLKTITTKIATVATYAWNAANMLLSKGFSVVTGAVRLLTNVMRANPILLIIGLIAAAAFWIIENWEKVKAFFQWLWDGIKSIFNNVWGYIKDWFMKFTPVGLVIKYWDPLVKWFSNLWNRVKGTFSAFWDFLKSIPSRMFEAGKNIVKSIWEGIKSMAMKPVEAIKEIVKKIRDMLPFSPAKVGPLRDIHRIRLVETIADSVKPTSLIEKMKSVVGATMNVVAPGAKAIAVSFVGGVSPVASPVGARGASSAGVNINYSPTITMAGGSPADQSSFARLLQDHAKMLTNMINEELRKQNRTKFA